MLKLSSSSLEDALERDPSLLELISSDEDELMWDAESPVVEVRLTTTLCMLFLCVILSCPVAIMNGLSRFGVFQVEECLWGSISLLIA